MALLDYLPAYTAAGLIPIAVRANSKRPASAVWQQSELGLKAAQRRLTAHSGNLGVTFPETLFCLDVDTKPGKRGAESLRALEARWGALPETLEQRSASGGRHLFFSKPVDVLIGNSTDKLGLHLDIRATGGQVVVEPSSIDGAEYTWVNWQPLTEEPPHIAPAPEWLLSLLSQSPAQPSPVPAEIDALDTYLSDEQVSDLRSALKYLDADSRDEWIAVGQALYRYADKGLDLWVEWASRSSKFDPDDVEARWSGFQGERTDIGAIFKRAQSAGWSNPRATSPAPGEVLARGFRFSPVGELLADRTPPQYLVKGLIEEGSLALLFGAPSSGKSFLALDLAASIAAGRDWCGRRVSQGPVFYIAGEGHAGVRRRLAAWSQFHGIALGDAPLFVSSMAIPMTTNGYQPAPQPTAARAKTMVSTADALADFNSKFGKTKDVSERKAKAAAEAAAREKAQNETDARHAAERAAIAKSLESLKGKL